MGLLITVEGGEFTGKSSLVVPTLTAVLERSGFSTMKSREPGGTPEGEEIRRHIFARLKEGASQEELAELFNQARRTHLDHVIKPFLGENKEETAVVILDRYIDSTIVYQGFEGHVSLEKLRELEQQATEGYYPDLTLLLYFPEDRFNTVFSARRYLSSNTEGRTQTTWDEGDVALHLERQRSYFKVPMVYDSWRVPRNFIFIDAAQHPRDVATDALLAVNPFLGAIEGNMLTEEERQSELLRAFNAYRAEGHLMTVEENWRRQEGLIHGEGNNNLQMKK